MPTHRPMKSCICRHTIMTSWPIQHNLLKRKWRRSKGHWELHLGTPPVPKVQDRAVGSRQEQLKGPHLHPGWTELEAHGGLKRCCGHKNTQKHFINFPTSRETGIPEDLIVKFYQLLASSGFFHSDTEFDSSSLIGPIFHLIFIPLFTNQGSAGNP